MNLNMDNCWGIISGLINLCHELLEHDGEHSMHIMHSMHSTLHNNEERIVVMPRTCCCMHACLHAASIRACALCLAPCGSASQPPRCSL